MKASYIPNDRDQELLKELFGAVCSTLTMHYGERVGASVSAPMILSYTSSFLLRYRIRGHPRAIQHVYVKIRRHPRMTSLAETQMSPKLHARMRDEYDSIRELYAMFDQAGAPFAAVRALGFLERVSAIVLEEYAGQTLRETLMEDAVRWSPRSRRGRLVRRANAAGGWLRRVHEAGKGDWNTLRVNDLHERETAPLLTGLRECGLDARRLARIERRFVAARPGVGDVRRGRSVDDFTTDNILYDAHDHVAVIDVKLRPAPLLRDLALAIVHPQTFRLQFVSAGACLSPESLRAYRAAVLGGYFGSDAAPAQALNYFCARNVLDKWLMYERIVAGQQGMRRRLTGAAAVIMRLYFERCIAMYLSAPTPAAT